MQRLPAHVNPVAVVYADWKFANAPHPESIWEAATAFGCSTILVDTYHKNGQTLLNHWTLDELNRWIEQLHLRDKTAVIAGSLNAESIQEILPLRPDIVAIRGAACHSDRTSTLSVNHIKALQEDYSCWQGYS